MENKRLFKYLDYVLFIGEMVDLNRNIYGYKAQLAEAAGCQRSFFSQVLKGSVHLTSEHAMGLATYWNLGTTEREYFLDLVLYARAGTKALRDFYRTRINRAREDQENLVKRITEKTILPDAGAAVFYSNWHYMAITMLLTIPQHRTIPVIAQRLELKEEVVKRALGELESLGIVVRQGSEWHATNHTIHLPRESQFNSLNHGNWRTRAVQQSYLASRESVHYTSVCSISMSDAERIKALVFQLVDESRKIIAPSQEEELFCLTCDWFRV